MYIASREDLEEALTPFKTAKEIALDIETTYNRSGGGCLGSVGAIRTIQLGIGHPFRPQELVIDMFHVEEDLILPLLKRSDVTWIVHNATFERSWLFYHYGIDLVNVYDTCVSWRELAKLRGSKQHKGAIYAQHGAALETLAREELNEELPKDCQTSDWGAEFLSLKQVRYAARDVSILIKLISKTRERVRIEGLDKDELWATMARSRTNLLNRHDPAKWAQIDESALLANMITHSTTVEELDAVWRSRRTLALYYQNRVWLKVMYRNRYADLVGNTHGATTANNRTVVDVPGNRI